MNQLEVLQNRSKKANTRITRNSKIFKTVITAILDKKGENVVSLDLRKIPEAVADFFVICQASNPSLLKAIADNVEYDVKTKCGEAAYKHEGRQGEQWILIDFVDVVVHIMLPEPRQFYGLEEMWSDAPSMSHED